MEVSIIQHLSSEDVGRCPKCAEDGALVKLITTFTTKPSRTTKVRTGHITEEFIQEARHDLKQQKKDLSDGK